MKKDTAQTQEQEYAIDNRGKVYKVKTNIAGEKIREEYTAARIIIGIAIVSMTFSNLSNRFSLIVTIVLTLIVAQIVRYFILNVRVDDKELEKYKAETDKSPVSTVK